MTVSNIQRRYTYLADGVTRDWPIEFSYHNSTDIKVYHISADGVETEITDITVVANNVTAPATGEPFASGESIRIERALPYTQLDDYTTQGAFTPEDMERTADRLIMITQQIRDVAEDTEDYVDENLPKFEEWKDITLEASGLAVAAKDRAVTAEDAAEYAQGQAEGARDTILANIAGAGAAQAAAEYAQGKAEQARDASVTAKGQSESARDAAVIAKTQSVGAKDISVSAKDDAVIAKTAAQTAQGLAEAARDKAQNWAEKTDGAVEGTSYSAKKHATDAGAAKTAAETAKGLAEAARDKAEDWAEKTDGVVEGTSYSAKKHAVDAAASAASALTDKGLAEAARAEAEDWATRMDGKVDDVEYSAKKYATDAGAAKTAAETAQGFAEAARDAAVAIAELDSPALSGTPTTPTPVPGTTTTQIANAKFVDDEFGSRAKTTPTAGKIPIADGNGKIDSGWVKDASETLKGAVELATSTESIAGTDEERAVHPAGVKAAIDHRIILAGGVPA